jgi:hypothetical protein
MENSSSSGSPEHPKKRTLSHWIGRILLWILATVGAVVIGLYLIAAGLVTAIPGGKSDRYVSVVLSPNRKFKAAQITYAGGGAISPYCENTVLVVPASIPDDVAEREKRYEVFSAECDTFADHSRSPKVEWISDSSLKITFSINSTALTGHKVSLKKIDTSGSVGLNFVAHE